MLPLCSAVLVVAAMVGADPTVEELAAAYDNAIASIHTLDVEVTQTSAEGAIVNQSHWSKDGVKERTRSKIPPADPNNFQPITFYSDSYSDGKHVRSLSGAEPNKIYLLKPYNQQGLSASITSVADAEPGYHQARFSLLLTPEVVVIGSSVGGMQELIASARATHGDTAARVVGSVSIEGSSCWQLHLVHPGIFDADTGKLRLKGEVDYFFDPAANYLLRRIDAQLSDPQGERSTTCRREVKRFKDCGNGVFFPEKTITGNLASQKPNPFTLLMESDVAIHAVNQSLSTDVFNFQFPEGIFVGQLPAVAGRMDNHLMNKEGEIIRTFHAGTDELNQYVIEHFTQDRMSLTKRSWFWPVTVGVVVAMALVVFFYRRRRT